MESTKQSRSRNAVDPTRLCQFSFADGRQCRMFRHQSHPTLCLVHARQEQQILAEEEIGEELKSISGQFRTTTDINHVIGKLFKLVAAGRIPARRAENLTYLAQLLLYSQKHIRYETNLAHRDARAWQDTVRAAYPAPQPEPQTPDPQNEDEQNGEQESRPDAQPVAH
jgi:hypothetical protein